MASISVQGVSKQFLLRKDRADSVGQLLVRMLPHRRRSKGEMFWALQDVSLEMPPGVSYGIIGSNGSGKSTLLKLLTRTMKPTKGQILSQGRISALIELGAGFHPDFTGRENVFLNASILGISRKEIEKKMDAIIEFAGIRPFIDTPVKYYSSGMHARLGFSVATSVEPEILIVDEVLAVGDEAFAQRCMDRIFKMKREGVSILLVSHDLSSIERLMDRAIWINKGVAEKEGIPRDVVFAYRQSMIDDKKREQDPGILGTQQGNDIIQFGAGHLLSARGTEDTVMSGERSDVVLEFDNHSGEAFVAHMTLSIRRPDGLQIASLSTLRDATPLAVKTGMNQIRLTLSELYLATGAYEADFRIHTVEGQIIAEWKPVLRFHVQSLEQTPGLIVLPHTWNVSS